jgi:hypothetical protein
VISAALLHERGDRKNDPEIESVAAELARRGIPFRYFLEKRLLRKQVALAPDVLVVGHIPVVIRALRQLGVEPPPANDYPASLSPWLHRHVWKTTAGEIVKRVHEERGLPVFAKPVGRLKRFPGQVIESWYDLRALARVGDRGLVYCSDVVVWKSEYRAYVCRGEILGVKHYRGYSDIAPAESTMKQAVAAFAASEEALDGCGIDFGVLDSGETALVEINEGYGLGAYGVDGKSYTDLLIARWTQLTKAL